MFDFWRITLFCLEKHLSKHKMTMFAKIWGGHGAFGSPLATPMPVFESAVRALFLSLALFFSILPINFLLAIYRTDV